MKNFITYESRAAVAEALARNDPLSLVSFTGSGPADAWKRIGVVVRENNAPMFYAMTCISGDSTIMCNNIPFHNIPIVGAFGSEIEVAKLDVFCVALPLCCFFAADGELAVKIPTSRGELSSAPGDGNFYHVIRSDPWTFLGQSGAWEFADIEESENES